MKSTEIEIGNPSGLHARPAAVFVRAAAKFHCGIRLQNLTAGRPEADAKSILGVLTAGVARGHRIRLVADGDDAEQAIAELRALIESGLGETLDADAAP
jgi:phosphotransferase system HPr (HPr) family protein